MAKSFVDIVIKARDVASGAITKVRGSLAKLEASAERIEHVSRGMLDFGVKVGAMGAAMAAAVAIPIKSAADFEHAMVKVKSLAGATEEEFAKLTETAKELGRTTKFTASEAAEGMSFLAMAGFKATEIIGAMPSVLQLAAAANLDLATAADITSNIMTGYSMTVKDLTRVNDVLVKSFTSANTDLTQLGAAMKYVGPIASSAGVAFEEVAAAVGLLGNAGIQATMAGTSLRKIISSLINPVGAGAKELKKLGLTIIDSQGKFIGLSEVIKQFAESFKDMGSDAERTAIIMKIFGDRAGPAMAALLAQGSEALEGFTENLKSAGGIAEKISKEQMDTLKGAVTKLSSALSGLLISIGEPFLKALAKLGEFLARAVTKITELKEALGPVGTIVFGLIGALGALLLIVGSVSVAIGAMGFAIAAGGRGFAAWKIFIPQVAAKLTVLKTVITSSTVATVGFSVALKTLLPILVAVIAYKLGDWLRGVEIGGRTVQNLFEQLWIHLMKIRNASEMAFLTWLKYLKKVYSLGLANTDNIDRQIERLQKQQEILDGAIDLIKKEKKHRKEISDITKIQQEIENKMADAVKTHAEEAGKANKKRKESYEAVLNAIEEGSEVYIRLKEKELTSLKAQIDYEVILEKQRYDKGEVSLKDYLDTRLTLQEEYTEKLIDLKEMQLENLKEDPKENLEIIKATEEEIKQLKLQSMQEQLQFRQDLTEGLKKEYESDFNNWQAVQARRLEALKNRFDLENTIEEAAAQQGLIKQSELLEGKLQRLREYYQMQIDIANETLLKIAEISGMENAEYRKMFRERERLQTDLEIKIIESEANIKEVRMNEEREAQKYIAELTGEREDLAELEAEEKLKILKQYYDQALISARQYTDAVAVIEEELTEKIREHAEKRTEITKGWIIVTRDTMNKVKEVLEDALNIDLEGIYARVTRFGRYLQNLFFPEFRDAIRQAVAEIKDIAGTLPGYLMDLARKVGMAVSATVFEYAQQVADYLNYVKGLLLELQGLISSYRKQLLQLRGDRIALIEMWYEEELAKLREKFKDLENTAEYKEAMRLIQELYKEKLEMAREAMEQEEGLWDNLAEKVSSSALKIKDAIKESIPGLVEGEFHLGTSQEITITKNIKLDSFFQIQTFDSNTTVRWLKDVVFPEWEKHLKLKGLKI